MLDDLNMEFNMGLHREELKSLKIGFKLGIYYPILRLQWKLYNIDGSY